MCRNALSPHWQCRKPPTTLKGNYSYLPGADGNSGRDDYHSNIPEKRHQQMLHPERDNEHVFCIFYTESNSRHVQKINTDSICLFVAFTWVGQHPQCLPPSWNTGLSLWYRQEPSSFSSTLKSCWQPRFTQLKGNKQQRRSHDKIE